MRYAKFDPEQLQRRGMCLPCAFAIAIVLAACVKPAVQSRACDWQGSGAYEGFTASAQATLVGDEVETFRVIGYMPGILDRSGGTCVFDLASVPVQLRELRQDGRIRVVNDKGEGEYYVGISVSSGDVTIQPHSACATGGLPSSIVMPRTSNICRVEW